MQSVNKIIQRLRFALHHERESHCDIFHLPAEDLHSITESIELYNEGKLLPILPVDEKNGRKMRLLTCDFFPLEFILLYRRRRLRPHRCDQMNSHEKKNGCIVSDSAVVCAPEPDSELAVRLLKQYNIYIDMRSRKKKRHRKRFLFEPH